MTTSVDDQDARIWRDPQFQAAMRRRARISWGLAALMCVLYFGFILLVAFAPDTLARSLIGGAMTIGIVAGLFVILSAFVLTLIYVAQANGPFDRAMQHIREHHQ